MDVGRITVSICVYISNFTARAVSTGRLLLFLSYERELDVSDQKHRRGAAALPMIINQANITDEEVTKKATAGESFSTFFFHSD